MATDRLVVILQNATCPGSLMGVQGCATRCSAPDEGDECIKHQSLFLFGKGLSLIDPVRQ